jgi:TonB family protein
MKKAREAALANRAPEVERWLGEAKAVGVSAGELNNFQRDLASAKQKAASAEAERLAGLTRDRIKDGKLTDPANDNAVFYLTALQAADVNNAAIAPASRELATKLLDRASAAARDGKTAQMDADLTQARRWGADAKDIQAVQQASASRKGATKPAASATQAADLSAKLKRTRYVDPEYPERALSQKISGFVTVEFTVNGEGQPADVRVVAAEPAGTFDRAAMAAVKRWRYEPMIVNNVPVEVPARTTIKFNLKSQ